MDVHERGVTVSRAEWEELRGELVALRKRVDELEHPPPSALIVPPGPPEPQDRAEGLTRRRALAGLAGAAAAGVAAVAATAEPAAAANGNNIVIGTANSGTQPTGLTVTGTPSYGIGVLDSAVPAIPGAPAVFGHAKTSAFYAGVAGSGESGATGVYAKSDTGFAIQAQSTSGWGAQIASSSTAHPTVLVTDGGGPSGIQVNTNNVHLYLDPGSATLPQDRGKAMFAGMVACDAAGALWYCTVSGTPGTWRKLSGPATAGTLHVLPTPKRIYDSRPGTSPAVGSKTPLPPNTARVLDLKVNSSGVPAGATAALLTVLLVNAAAGNGNLTVWANGVAKPASNTMVWGPDGGRFTATAVSALSSGAGIQVQSSLTTDLVIDVVGYYR